MPASSPSDDRTSSSRELILVSLFAIAATIVVTWPVSRHLASSVHHHDDALFSMWRVSWIAHALSTDPLHLFDANVFHPVRLTFLFSDALLLPGLLGTPALLLSVPTPAVYNVLLLAGYAGSAVALYVLARDCGASPAGALLGAAVFAWSPYRTSHVQHLELQWALWLPLAILSVRRTLASVGWRAPLSLTLTVVATFLSSVYYGIFLLLYLPLWSGVAAIVLPDGRRWRRLLVAGVALACALAVVGPYLLMYGRARLIVGERSETERVQYSARWMDFLSVPVSSRWAGTLPEPETEEGALYPGATPLVLALAALAPPSRLVALPFVAGLGLAVDGARGERGVLVPGLAAVVRPLRGLRVAARFAVLVQLSLGVLAALGLTALTRSIGGAGRRHLARVVAIVSLALCMAEYATLPLATRRVASDAPPVYRWLAGQPRGVVLELPLPDPSAMWLYETTYQYMSTFHWFPLVNGYSGYAPPSYLRMIERMRGFPDAEGLHALGSLDVTYVLVHEGYFSRAKAAEMRTVLDAHPAFSMRVRLPDAAGAMTAVYRLDRSVLTKATGRDESSRISRRHDRYR